MNFLELKIPPPVVALAFGVRMWFVALLGLILNISSATRIGVAISLAVVGKVISVSGIIAFRKKRTTINPVNPNKSTALVQNGIFRYTRNPMYVGLALTLLGWAAFLASLLALVFVPLFVLYISRFQISPEERGLSSLFGSNYTEYQRNVRRWL